jgi:hypothetical protein
MESDLGDRVYINEWPSHFMNAVGARSKETQQICISVMQQCTTHRGWRNYPGGAHIGGLLDLESLGCVDTIV